MHVGTQRIAKAKEWYETHERRVSTFSLLFGFVFDSLTLQRIDALRENLWIVFNLLVVGTCITLLNRQENDGVERAEEARSHFWLFNFLQFGFGALLGTFFIFYFRSATLTAAWPFLLMLLGAMVANELFQKRYARLTFQISFFYLALLLFAIFLVPIAFKSIGPWIFILSGLVSLFALWLFVLVLKKFSRESFKRSERALKISITTIFLGINVLYFANLIPPIPLSLKDAGVYHSVGRASDGRYVVEQEHRGFMKYFQLRERIHLAPGEPAYVYSAIYSPAAFNTRILHEWQYKDEERGEWVTASRIPLTVSGGREQGFRTYSTKTSHAPGLWRVNVLTSRGQAIGRITFRIERADTAPDLEVSIKD